MKTRLIATLTALTASAFAADSVRAEDTGVTLAWQQPGYVMEVVVVTAPRPAIALAPLAETDAATENATEAATGEVALAWQEPGYVEEVVVVTASRSEVLAAARRAAIEAALERDRARRDGPHWRWLGTPAN